LELGTGLRQAEFAFGEDYQDEYSIKIIKFYRHLCTVRLSVFYMWYGQVNILSQATVGVLASTGGFHWIYWVWISWFQHQQIFGSCPDVIVHTKTDYYLIPKSKMI
jgi:hypothetical protein